MAAFLMQIFTLVMALAAFTTGHSLLHRALRRLDSLRSRERLIFAKNSLRKDDLAAYKGHAFVTRPTPEASVRYNYSLVLEYATLESAKSPHSESTNGSGLDTLEIVVDERLPFYCHRESTGAASPCDGKLRYRSFNGRCNNLRNPLWGKHTIPLKRILSPLYDDGVSRPKIRSSRGAHPLPNVRTISNRLHRGGNSLRDERFTLLLMQWGQFVDHDITSTPMVRGLDDSSFILDCTECDSNAKVHEACFPILIPTGDPFFPTIDKYTKKRKCLPFTRSMSGQGSLGPRQQLNQNTGLLDSSHIYGSTICTSDLLRTYKNGQLLVTEHPTSPYLKPLMPMTDGADPRRDECRSRLGMCFHAGDDRSNEQPGLASMHTLLMREHNRLSEQLSAINRKWDDEMIFQEARRIVIAINQHLTYREFLPRVLGPKLMRRYELTIRSDRRYFTKYNPKCSPDIFNEFSTAAFRFGHTLVSSMYEMPKASRTSGFLNASLVLDVRLREHFNNPDVVHKAHFIDSILSGLSKQRIEAYDGTLASDLRNHLFEHHSASHSGLDLASLNLQRGRDHGIPGYIHYRAWCHPWEQRMQRFDELRGILRNADIVSSVYRDVDDIDLFTGGLLEKPVKGGIVGPTLGCIIAQQFRHLRFCDRFWYETPNKRFRFTTRQLKEIKRITLSSVLCHNCDVPRQIQKYAMDVPHSDTNPYYSCDELPKIDITHWKDVGVSAERRADSADAGFCEIRSKIIPFGSEKLVSPCVRCMCVNGEAVCLTIRVSSCSILVKKVGKEAVLLDEFCLAQCPKEML